MVLTLKAKKRGEKIPFRMDSTLTISKFTMVCFCMILVVVRSSSSLKIMIFCSKFIDLLPRTNGFKFLLVLHSGDCFYLSN